MIFVFNIKRGVRIQQQTVYHEELNLNSLPYLYHMWIGRTIRVWSEIWLFLHFSTWALNSNPLIYKFWDGIWFKKWHILLTPPSLLIDVVLHDNHSILSPDHFWLKKTLHWLRSSFTWSRMKASVKNLCKSVMFVKGDKVRRCGQKGWFNR